MDIAIIGTGYVGLVTGVAFANVGHNVYCVDVDNTKIENLKNGIIPIYEVGLNEILNKCYEDGNLHFTTDLKSIINKVDVVFSCVGTPPDEDGSADLTYVLNVAREVGQYTNKDIVLVTKSTVPVGTAKRVYDVARGELDKRSLDYVNVYVASNPEFLKEGSAVYDVLNPDRIVIGVDSEHAKSALMGIYKPFNLSDDKYVITDVPSAEMIKYASNSMLATRISFMNELANLCEKVNADINMVRLGMGLDKRIGMKFLNAGCGYGGSCFPKDVKALIHTGIENGVDLTVLKSVDTSNDKQKVVPFNKLTKYFGSIDNLNGKVITLWGLAFKPGTNDMREATALTLINKLSSCGCIIKVYDPIAMDECKRRCALIDNIYYYNDKYDAAIDSDAVILVTEWDDFKEIDWKRLMSIVRCPILIDGRNIYNKDEVKKHGFFYEGIGR